MAEHVREMHRKAGDILRRKIAEADVDES